MQILERILPKIFHVFHVIDTEEFSIEIFWDWKLLCESYELLNPDKKFMSEFDKFLDKCGFDSETKVYLFEEMQNGIIEKYKNNFY